MKLKKTISTIFIVPTLEIPSKALQENGFINAYSYETNEEKQYEDAVYLVFKPKSLAQFEEFLNDENERTHLLIDDYDYDEFVVVVYKLPIKWEKDFKLIKEGKYSKTSDDFQQVFPKVKKKINNKGLEDDLISLQWQIFKKDPALFEYWESKIGKEFKEDMEFWEGFSLERETLKRELLYE